jgi:hypothetical protein
LLNVQEAAVFTIVLAAVVASVLLFVAVALFERKQF